MKTNLITLILIVAAFHISQAQLFLQGTYVEIGIHSSGSYGSDVAPPAGYHPTQTCLGFVCDYTGDGWGAGTPVYMGDYFVPGSPEEGWGVEWNSGATSYNKNNFGLNGYFDIPQTSLVDASTPTEKIGIWEGTATDGIGGSLKITQLTRLGMGNKYFTIEVMMLNNGTTTLQSLEYLRNVDPDNEIDWTGDYTTSNYVVAQPGVGGNPDIAVVVAHGLIYGAPLYLGTIDPRARVSVEGFSNRDPDDIWDSPLMYSAGAPSVMDEAIALAYRFDDLAPGECVTFTYYYGLEEVDPGDVVFPLTVDFIHDPATDTFTEDVTGNGVAAIIEYYWDFDGDGVYDATGPTAVHDFGTGGSQSVTLTVELCDGTLHDTTLVLCDFTPDLGDDQTVCSGVPVTLDPGPGVSFAWSPGGATSPTLTVTTPGTYSVTVTDADGCTGTDNIVVSIGSTLSPDLGPDIAFCEGESAILNPGTFPNYVWTGGSTDPTLTVTTGGTYSVTVSDGVGCSGTNSILVTVNPNPTVSFNIPEIECFGDQISISYTGSAVAADTYTWDFDGGTVASGSGIGPYTVSWGAAGPHTISLDVETVAGCINNGSQDVTEPSQLVASVAIDNMVSCNGYCDGGATVTVSGATTPYTFDWSNSAETAISVTTLCANTYNVTVTDDNGCSVATNSIVITEPDGLTVTDVITDAQCYGYSDGSVDITVSGGQVPYSYEWTNDTYGQDLFSVSAGSYSVTISDGNTCTSTYTYIVGQPPVFAANISSVQHVSCFGECDGSATVTVVGGVPAYIIDWESGGSGNVESALCGGTYDVSVTDANGCTVSTVVVITEPPVLAANILQWEDISCYGYDDGTATVTVTGGTGPYTYSWSSGTGATIATGMEPGNNTVTVTDDNECSVTASVVLTEPTQITSTISGVDLVCHGYQNGSVNLEVAGGSPPYTYLWSNMISDQDLFGISGGDYYVTVTDANGCTITNHQFIYEPPAINITTSPDAYICISNSTIISAAATGGTFPYTYVWNGSMVGASQSVSPIVDQTYNLTVTDAQGCTNTATVVVYVYDSLELKLSIEDPVICLGEPAVINSVFSGGNGGPYILSLEDGTYINNPYVTYPEESMSFRIYLNDWCGTPSVYADISVIVIDPPVVTFAGDDLAGCEPHLVNFNAYSENTALEYLWNFGNGNYSFIQNPTTNYQYDGVFDVSVTVTDTNGCKTTETISDYITVYPLPVARFYPEPPTTSVLKPFIYFNNVSSDYVTENYWFFGDGDSSDLESPLHYYPAEEREYDVTLIVETAYGCRDTATAPVSILDEYTFWAPTGFTPNNDGINDIFFVDGHGIDVENFAMYIYDRWGELVFTTNEFDPENPQNNGWDGRIKDNKLAPSGVYTWLVIYRDWRAVEHQEAGPVTLMR